MKNPEIQKVIKSATDIYNNYEYEISVTKKSSHTSNKDCTGSKIELNFSDVDNGEESSDFKDAGITDVDLVGHEIKHAFDNEHNANNRGKEPTTKVSYNEIEAVKFENLIREEEKRPLRTNYGVSIWELIISK